VNYYSNSYTEARSKFLHAASALETPPETYYLNDDEDLAVDVATIGAENRPVLLISSGLHGIEGFLGSAVQLAILDLFKRKAQRHNIRLVLVHALNPYGFKFLRRFDQSNIDLNRNFLLPGELFSGSPAGYVRLNDFLNPDFTSDRFDFYRLHALWNILKYGLPQLKEAIVRGQYEYPEGLFYGGATSSASAELVKTNCDNWVGSSETVAHIDIHTGLGSFASYKLLLNEDENSPNYSWYKKIFGPKHLEPLTTANGTAYKVTGSLGTWIQYHFRERRCYSIGAEFGTYGPVRVLGSLRAENRAFHHSNPSMQNYKKAKAELLECFCPKSELWRTTVMQSALKVISTAIEGLSESAS